ncbi:MAG: hypothetical protein JOZ41_17695, partial [Chloroflexi bacterium]|nr:hypothetical protein [Chloroflexota bacterium]
SPSPGDAGRTQSYRATDAAPAGPGPGTLVATRRRSRRPALIIPAVLILLLLAGGTAAAFTVPAFGVTAETSLGQMLPASTVFYVSANLNPTGATRTNLDRIERAYTSQPGWSTIASTYNKSTENNTGSSGSCYRQTKSQITDHTGDLGQDTALVMTSPQGINASNTSDSAALIAAVKRDFVVVAPLNAKRTLVQVLTGYNFSLPQKSQTYHGTTIYAETFQSCNQASGGTASTVYAALVKNWVVLGLVPQAIYPIVDTAKGQIATLASTNAYSSLMSKLASDHLGSYYLNGKELAAAGVYDALKNVSSSTNVASPYLSQTQVPAAGTLSVDSHGFDLTAAAYNASGNVTTTQSGGAAASLIPADALGLLSVQGLRSTLTTEYDQLKSNGLISASISKTFDPIVSDITTDMSGETDLIMLRPRAAMNANDPSTIPLTLMWQENNDASASQHLQDVVTKLGLGSPLTSATASDGTQYYATKQGIGYAVRKGWAIVSLSLPAALNTLAARPPQSLASVDSFKRGIPGSFTPTGTLYLDARGLRTSLENLILPTQDSTQQASYNNQVKPFIAPIQTISGSAGSTNDGEIGISTLIVDIGTPTGS